MKLCSLLFPRLKINYYHDKLAITMSNLTLIIAVDFGSQFARCLNLLFPVICESTIVLQKDKKIKFI
jgi:hypothetical protein